MKRQSNIPFIKRIMIGIAAISLCACSSSNYSESSAKTEDTEPVKEATETVAYENKLFDTSYVHTMDIVISEEDWADLKANPTAKTKYKTDVTIDGETIESVSFATKGNTSLSSVAQDENSDRYSFKVNFGKYVDGQTYHGLNKLNLNNIYADATYMKDYLSYEIFREAGVASPLVSYVWLTINGQDHGLYIAIEDISESYLDRTANGEGELYKPETEQLDNMGKMGEFDKPDFPEGMNGERPQMPDNMPQPKDGNGRPGFPNGGQPPQGGPNQNGDGEMPAMPDMNGFDPMGGFGSSSKGADLKYTDGNLDSYSDIFENDETKASDESKSNVIAALKALSEGNDIASYIDTDEVIRYFVAHNFVLNYDSYTGNMLHNYYLYERDGKLSMLPWDYNLAFGAFSAMGKQGESSDATSLINTGIDTPLSTASDSDRPMWSWIVSDETYTNQYHEAYEQLLTYFESEKFDEEIERLYNMIKPYVEKDRSAFYTSEEFTKGYETLKEFCHLRAESIRKQLDGTLSTKTSEQNDTDKVDASSITINDMGTQGQGKEMPGGFGEWDTMTPPAMPNENMENSDSTVGS